MQFLELVQAGIVRPRLYGAITEPATPEEIENNVASALSMFMAAYGTAKAR